MTNGKVNINYRTFLGNTSTFVPSEDSTKHTHSQGNKATGSDIILPLTCCSTPENETIFNVTFKLLSSGAVFQKLPHMNQFYTQFDWLIFKETLKQMKTTLFQLLWSCACVCSDNNCVSIWQKQRARWKCPKVVCFYSRWNFFFLIPHWWLIPPCWTLLAVGADPNFSLRDIP